MVLASKEETAKKRAAYYQNGGKEKARAYRLKNLEKFRARDRLRSKSNPNRIKQRKAGRQAYNLKRRYGLSLSDYQDLIRKTNNECVICKKELVFGVSSFDEPKNMGTNSAISCIDHNHKTGRVREIICIKCNSIIGLCGERIEVLLEVINYLNKHA